jgi:ankyrin repeat protein
MYEKLVGKPLLHRLSAVAKLGNIELLKHFLKEAKDNISTSDYDALFEDIIRNAASNGRLSVVKYFLDEHQEEPDRIVYLLTRALTSAVIAGRLPVVKYIVEHIGKFLRDVDLEGWLIDAATYGRLPVVKYLIDNIFGTDMVITSAVFSRAAENGHLPIVKYLVSLEEEGSYDIQNDVDGALAVAALRHRLPVVEYLVNRGARIDPIVDHYLEYAATYGHWDIIEYLINHEATTIDLNRLLTIAIKEGNLDMVKYLVTHGSNIKIKRMISLARGKHKAAIIEYLSEFL